MINRKKRGRKRDSLRGNQEAVKTQLVDLHNRLLQSAQRESRRRQKQKSTKDTKDYVTKNLEYER